MHIWTVKHFSVYKMVAYYVTYCKHIGCFFYITVLCFCAQNKVSLCDNNKFSPL